MTSTEFDRQFAQSGAADASLVTFGEWITYRPVNGAPRRIRAIVDRGEGLISTTGGLAMRPTYISAEPHGSTGWLEEHISEQLDRVSYAQTRGGTRMIDATIMSVPDADGLVRVEVM